MNYKILLPLFSLLFLSGCSSYNIPKVPIPEPISSDTQMVFTYNFDVPSTKKSLLWKRARDYFAGSYGDFRSVFSVMDKEDGTLIGNAVTNWYLFSGTPYVAKCSTKYHVRFVANNNKARLQLEIINGAPATSGCGWDLPTEKGYKKIVGSFALNAKAVEKALNGEGASNTFKIL